MGNVLCCIDEKRGQYYSAGEGITKEDMDDMQLRHSGVGQIGVFHKRNSTTSLKHPISSQEDRKDEHEEERLSRHERHQEEYTKQPLNDEEQTIQKMMSASPPSQSIAYDVDDQLHHYEFPESYGDDQEIEELAKLKNQHENEMVLSKRGVTEYIESIFRMESSECEDIKKWELKLNKEDIKVWVKKSGGSRFNSEHPYIKTEMIFNAAFSMRKVIQVIFDSKLRTEWDNNVLKLDQAQLDAPLCSVKYQQNKGILAMNHKEFVDKQFMFADLKTGKFYAYYSQIPDGSHFEREKLPKTDRACTIVGIQTMERRPEDGKIVYSMLMQVDLKMSVTPKLISMFLPKGLQEWMSKCNKFINNNYDRI